VKRVTVIALLAVTLLGCSQLDLKARGRRLDIERSNRDMAYSRARARTERLSRAFAIWQEQSRDRAPDYILGPGDLLEISVFGLESPNAPSKFTCEVGQDGDIALPWADPIQARGSSVEQLKEHIRSAYAGSYIKDPQVTARVMQYRGTAVVVTGAVGKPGVYYLTENRSTVLEVLAQAGGLSTSAGDELVLVRGAGASAGTRSAANVSAGAAAPDSESELVRIDLEELLDQGNLLLNVPVGDGDILTVPPRERQYVYVLGYVRRPGAQRIEDGMRLDALRALALGGGPTPTGRVKNTYLVRETPTGQETRRINLTRAGKGIDPPVYMEPGDMLIVGSNWWAKLSEVVRPSVGTNISASAAIVP
jgi:polysaccharide export outer membrane protein